MGAGQLAGLAESNGQHILPDKSYRHFAVKIKLV